MMMTMTMGPQGDDGRNVLDFYTCRGDFFGEMKPLNEIKGCLIFSLALENMYTYV